MPLSPEARLGPYIIISQLGKGGMGEVYRARDSRLDRDVAIKILSPDLTADENAFIRFEREAKALAALSHTNILAIYDFQRADDQSFVVMELLEGETLRSQLARSALPWSQAVDIGIALSDGLHAAHSKGILHRDLKPENIFITHDGQLKILDFGLARLQKIGPLDSQSMASTLSQTQPGVLFGTIPYMSPEQLRGFPADARSDLFSLGIVLFEMVTGKSPFKGNTPAETISAIMNEDPPDLGVDGSLPDSLRYTIRRCLHKDPDQRIQTARELATDLRSIQHGAQITIPSTRPPIRMTRARLFLVLAMLLVLLPAGYFAFYRHGSSNISSLAILPFANVSGDPDTDYLSDGITESLINSMSRLPQLSVIARTSAFRFKGTTIDPLEIGRQLNVDAVLTGKILQRSGQLIIQADLMKVSTESQLWGDQYSRRLADLLSVQEEIVTEIATNLVPKLSGEQKQSVSKTYTENSEAHLLYLRGMHHWWKSTEDDYEKARDYFQQSIDKDPSYALAHVGLGDYYLAVAAEGFAPPSEAWPKAATAYRKALEIDKRLALAHRGLGRFESDYHWNWAAAEKELQLALQLEPRNARIHFTYSWYLIGRGKVDSALQELQQAQDLDPLNRSYSLQLGQLLTFTGRYDEGIAQLNRTIELDSKYDAAYFSLADAYERKGMYDEAIAESRKAALLIGDEYAADLYAKAQGAAGYSAAKKAIAIDRLETLKELSTEEYVSPLMFAQIYVQLGNKDQAFYWLNRAAEERSTLFFLKIHPDWEPIRSDPRFAKLVERIGLQ